MRLQLILTSLLLCAPHAFASTGGDGEDATCQKKTDAYALTAEDKAKVNAIYEKLLRADMSAAKPCTKVCMSEGCVTDCIGAVSPERMAKMLKKETVFTMLAPVMAAHFADKKTPAAERGRIVDFLALTPGKPAVHLGAELYAKTPEAFGEDHLLAFAENGSKEFGKHVAELASTSPRAAAFLALRGKDAGRKALLLATKQCKKTSGCSKRLSEGYVAAAGLAALGEKQHLQALETRMHDDVLAALDRGDFKGARKLALEAEFLAKSFSGKWQRLSYLEGRMQWHVAQRSSEVEDADQVFEIIEAATPISG